MSREIIGLKVVMGRVLEHPPRVRRWLLVLGLGLLVAHGAAGRAEAQSSAPWQQLEEVRALLDGAEPAPDGVTIEAPSVTQDGSAVPLSVSVDAPTAGEDYVEALYVFASRNPSPEVAEFQFTPLAGAPRISTRIRLDETQRIIALARTHRGDWLVGWQEVRVTVSGCLSSNDTPDFDDAMTSRVRGPEPLAPGETGKVRTLIQHPMETGLRTANGETIPKRIVHRFEAELEGEPVLSARLHRAISANPYLVFTIAPQRSGELRLQWEEGGGESAVETVDIVAR